MFILKSRSPRRIQILKDLGIRFTTDPSDIDESERTNETPLSYLERMARSKLGEIPSDRKEFLHLSCDTIVVNSGKILHKPVDEEDSFRILKDLNGKEHSVFSGACLHRNDRFDFFYEETKILFYDWSDSEIRNYISEAKPFDKAGSYGIQDKGSPVKTRSGSYHNVMGFPLRSFLKRWEDWVDFWEGKLRP